MAEFPMISDDVDLVKVAFCAPAPRHSKRRIESGGSAGVRRPFWAPDKGSRSRVDATSAAKGYFARHTESSSTGLAGAEGVSERPRFTERRLVCGDQSWAHPRNSGSSCWHILNNRGQVMGRDAGSGGRSYRPSLAAPRRKAQRIRRLKDTGRRGSRCTT